MLRILAVIASAAVLIGAAVYVLACPCGPVPGLWLFGDRATEPVDDWAFVNDAGLCQLQVQTWKPHTLNLNCMSDNGDLFVSCSNCAGKSWSNHVLTKPQGYIKAGDAVYPVTLARVTG